MTLSLRARRIFVAFVLSVGAIIGTVAVLVPEGAELAFGVGFLVILIVSLRVSRPQHDPPRGA